MSLLLSRARRGDVEDYLNDSRASRLGRGGAARVDASRAMRLSVVWECRRLRADLVSTMPLDVFRRVNGVQLTVPKPPVFVTPGGRRCRWMEWVYSTQMDLDGYGNCFGVIEERDSSPQRRPSVIRPVPASSASVRLDKTTDRLVYRFGSETYDEADVWHEKQFTVPGSHVGLSPIAHAAMTMQTSLSAAEFASRWFNGGAAPGSHLKNTGRKLDHGEARRVKANYKNQVQDGDVFVSGNDWELKMLDGKASEAMFLEQQNASAADVCRFFGVPGDLVGVHADTSSITYANIGQRNLQFLIMNLNPAILRREDAFTYDLLPAPRYAKFNRGSLQQMDAETRSTTLKTRIDSRQLTPDEARELEDLPPLTEQQIAQFAVLFKNQNPPMPVVAPGGTP